MCIQAGRLKNVQDPDVGRVDEGVDGSGDADFGEESGDNVEPVSDEEASLLRRIEKDVRDCEATDIEDAPDWEFEDGETKSKDKTYVFCPAEHRAGVLHRFTKHFCRHSIFPIRLADVASAADIRKTAVMDMYQHCKRNGLSEVWAYLWASWYSPSRWELWSRSTSPLLSRLRTTMTVENHWKQLKHHHLHFMHRPRLDHVLYVLCTEAIPQWMVRAETLEDTYKMGRSKGLSAFQKAFKVSWREKAEATVSKTGYKVDVAQWLCNCGAQETDTHHLCKHLVQAVPPPPIKFWSQIVRRRCVPIYRHPCLHQMGGVGMAYLDAFDGCVTDGDDHDGIWGPDILEKPEWTFEEGGGWREAIANGAAGGKRRWDADTSEDDVRDDAERADARVEDIRPEKRPRVDVNALAEESEEEGEREEVSCGGRKARIELLTTFSCLTSECHSHAGPPRPR